MEMIRPENFKEELDDNNLNNLELQKKGVQTQIAGDVDKQRLLNSIAESAYREIEKLPVNSEFSIGQFFKGYNFEKSDMFYLCKQVVSYCTSNNVVFVEKMPDADLGMPWHIPRIRK